MRANMDLAYLIAYTGLIPLFETSAIRFDLKPVNSARRLGATASETAVEYPILCD